LGQKLGVFNGLTLGEYSFQYTTKNYQEYDIYLPVVKQENPYNIYLPYIQAK